MAQMTPQVSKLLEQALSLSVEEQQALADSPLIGFSFPDGDQRARELLARAVKGRRETVAVVIVNPQHQIVEQKLTEFLNKGSYVVTARHKTFSDFLSH
jgi:hypothetical protein